MATQVWLPIRFPGQNQNNISIKPCHFLLHHHQAFRGDTRGAL